MTILRRNNKGMALRFFIVFITFCFSLGAANALTPLPDNSPAFFAGEWAGAGEHGAFCYISLAADGSGQVLIDGGSGDWLGAGIQWHNQQQSVQVDKIMPHPFSAYLRVMPLVEFVLNSEFNQSLKLTWTEHSAACHLQKLETTAQHLGEARSTLEKIQAGEKQ